MSATQDNFSKSDFDRDEGVDWITSLPFILCHLMPLGALWSGVRGSDFLLMFGIYGIGMFFVTAGYHRYFSHRSYRTGRLFQFLLAFGAQVSAQKGVLWWAGHHRHHHLYSDTLEDVHSPKRGFFWSHVGWILSRRYSNTDLDRVRDLAKYPELRFLDRWHLLPPVLAGALVFWSAGASALFIGFFGGLVLLWHGTFLINSLAHVFGSQRYATSDTSRNSLFLALLTHGEGWHNNHHHYQSAARQGFFWWEVDLTYYVLRVLALCGIVRDLRQPPGRVFGGGEESSRPPVRVSRPRGSNISRVRSA